MGGNIEINTAKVIDNLLENELVITEELMDDYLKYLDTKGRSDLTRETYRRNLKLLYNFLPTNKTLRRGTMDKVKNLMLEAGYAPQSINNCISVANGLVSWCGLRELQVDRLEGSQFISPELTRNEYMRLLSTAKVLEKERDYLLIKVFATTGISIQSLEKVTVESMTEGYVKDEKEIIHFPECVKKELLSFAKKEGRTTGPIFVSLNGKPLTRTMVTHCTQSVCEMARVDKEKASPRCLRKLYQDTKEGILRNLSMILEETYTRIIETEQITIGWDQ